MNIDFKTLAGAKSFDELMTEARRRMKESTITNWNDGGVFKTLAALSMQGLADLYELLYKTVLPNCYAHSASGKWLDLIAKDVDVERHLATKAQGMVTFSRDKGANGVIKIEAGTIVKTEMTASGDELRYFVLADALLEANAESVEVLCQAEFEGATYNVGQGMLKILVTHISGVTIENKADWVTKEGADEESDEDLRERYFLKWNELSTGSTALAYKSWAKSVPGVLDAAVDDMHPRGQGTVDIIITSSDGAPTAALKQAVFDFVETKRPQCSDVLVREPELLATDIDVELWLPIDAGDTDEVTAAAQSIIQALFVPDEKHRDITAQKIGAGFYTAKLNRHLMELEHVFNVVIHAPAADVLAEKHQLVKRDGITVSIRRVKTK